MNQKFHNYLKDCLARFEEPVTEAEIKKTLNRETLSVRDLAVLLSPRAVPYLEIMARKSMAVTQKNFGRAVLLYAPIYLSNYCTSPCTYCSFSCRNTIQRSRLDNEGLRQEAQYLLDKGIQHILILTGCSQKHSPPEWIAEKLAILRGVHGLYRVGNLLHGQTGI